MEPIENHQLLQRRAFLGQAARGLGQLALLSMLEAAGADSAGTAARAESPAGGPAVSPLHRPPRVKRVIFLCMSGGPSHLETFDFKPRLASLDGRPMPASYTSRMPVAQLQGKPLICKAPQYPFRRYGQSGQEVCTLFPHIGSVADEICIVRSMVTDAINHDPAQTFMNTGTTISGRPSMGSWVTYGLGSETSDLPGFVVLTSTGKFFGLPQPISSRQWHSGFLPGRFQGVRLNAHGDPVYYLDAPPGVTQRRQQEVIETVKSLDSIRNSALDDPALATRVSQYEMAFRMQASVPGLMDLSDEPAEVKTLYGTNGADGSFAANCLLARRLAERGVRFIQLYHRDWDHHIKLREAMEARAGDVDRASAALLIDLKRRGMLDDTLVIWGGEFGRTPMAQGDGRDHNSKGFSIWLAGGGIKHGAVVGKTDELGYAAVDDVVHVHDLHATMLHLLGIDHRRLTFRHQGRDFRLTDVAGRVVASLLS